MENTDLVDVGCYYDEKTGEDMERGGAGRAQADYLTFSHWDQLSHLAWYHWYQADTRDPVWADSHWDWNTVTSSLSSMSTVQIHHWSSAGKIFQK